VTDRIEVTAPGKVNLLLRVLAREESGYHGVETLLCRLRLADEITVERASTPGVRLDVQGPDTGPHDQNLVTRAARLVLEATGDPFGVNLTLTKRIPVAAGLGGGSSDAAAALQAVNALAGGAVPAPEILQFAARLGADVPFFLAGGDLALGWGHGDRLIALPSLPSAPMLLVDTGISIPTVDAYGWVDVARADASQRGALGLDLASLSSWGSIGRMAGNDFEAAIFPRHPQIREAFEALARTGPLLCRMTGSGSTVFGVYRTAGDRDEAAIQLGTRFGKVISTDSA
jgi:4-diphosphocytidyl-2-C-methyl-D-erythritol kinase